MLPYATEQQVLKIVEQKLRESGGGDTPSEDKIIAIVNKAIEDGDINVSAFDEVEVKFYYSDFSIHDGRTYIGSTDKKEILNNLIDKIFGGKFASEIITFPTPLAGIVSIENIPFSQVNMDGEIVWLSNFDTSISTPQTIACGIARWGNEMALTFSNFNSQALNALVAGMAADPTQYISLKFRVEK